MICTAILLLWGITTWAVDNINIVFIGNSITYGATLGSPSTEAPPVRVREILSAQMANKVNIANCGHSGSTTVDWLPGTSFFNEARTQAALLNAKGGVLFFSLMLGTNDSASSGPTGSPVSLTNYQANVRKIIDTLLKEFPNARFIINYPIWYSPNTHNGATYLQAGLNRLKTYHTAITSMGNTYAQSGTAVYLGNQGAFSFFENNTKYFTAEGGYSGTFYLHPNKEGAIKLAEFWAASIAEHAQDVIDTVSMKYIAQLDAAKGFYNRCFTYAPLVTKASQLKSNSVTMQGQLASLIDGQLAQNLQTWPDYGPDQYCYIQAQVDLSEQTPVYVGFTVPSGSYPGDYPAEIKVQQSTDGTTWKGIATLQLLAPNMAGGTWVNSDLFQTEAKAKYLRFTSIHNSTFRAGDHHFAIGEFNIFTADKANSLYFLNADAQQAADLLLKAITDFEAKLNGAGVTDADAALLQQATDKVAAFFAATDRLTQLVDSAKAMEACIYATSDGLIRRLAQITTNASGNDNPNIPHNLENLYDNNVNTVYQTWPAFPASGYSYLQFDLSQTPVRAFRVMFTPYQNEMCGVPDLPYKVKFQFSNDGGRTWAQTIDHTFTLTAGFGLDDVYLSPFIEANNKYGTVRMQMIQHQADRPSSHPKLFGMSEFQIYALSDEAPCHDATVLQRYSEVQSLVYDATLKLENATATPDDVAQLEQALIRVQQAIDDYLDQLSSVRAVSASNSSAQTQGSQPKTIHSLDGLPLAEPQSGLNIINGHVVSVK